MKNDNTAWALEYLPEQLKDLIDVIGLDATQKLVDTYGGLRVRIPLTMPTDHVLAKLIGYEAAHKLAHHYAGERLDIAKAHTSIMAYRNEMIRREHGDGASGRALAYRYRLTERRIWEILAGSVTDDRQADMFES